MRAYFGGVFFLFFLFGPGRLLRAQAPDAAAIEASDARFRFWAGSVEHLQRGWKQAGIPDSGRTSVGEAASALGPALQNGVISLGDGGSVTLRFPGRIQDGPGPDFAVFENGFSDFFLELAFVEVSSDGQHFVRFPAVSQTPTTEQIGPFHFMDPTKIENLAGKYRAGWGTPFDLALLSGQANLDLSQIRFVRIIDVVGSLNPRYGSYDSRGNLVNDPFPTPFPSGGFDLDAVGVLNGIPDSPLSDGAPLRLSQFDPNTDIQFFEVSGKHILTLPQSQAAGFSFPAWFPALVWIRGRYQGKCISKAYRIG